jgi:hypothetical protein
MKNKRAEMSRPCAHLDPHIQRIVIRGRVNFRRNFLNHAERFADIAASEPALLVKNKNQTAALPEPTAAVIGRSEMRAQTGRVA